MTAGQREPGIRLIPWGLLGTLTVPLAIGAMVVWFRIHPPILFGDVAYYASALPALTSDAPLYDPASFQPHTLPPPPFWDQAPSMAVLASVLLLPSGNLIWGLLMAACVVAGLLVMLPRVGGGGVVLIGPVLLVLPPVLEALAWANHSSIAFLALAVALRWPRLAGGAIGIAAAAKLMPIMAVAWLIGRRDWRGVALALAIPAGLTAIAMVLAGPTVVIDFVRVRFAQDPLPGVQRWGLSDWGVPEPITWTLAFITAGIAAWRASFSLAVLSILLVSPAFHMHYLTMALVPAVGIWIPWAIGRLRTHSSTSREVMRDHRAIRMVPPRT
jgi:Glycosyltransferase family 87